LIVARIREILPVEFLEATFFISHLHERNALGEDDDHSPRNSLKSSQLGIDTISQNLSFSQVSSLQLRRQTAKRGGEKRS